MQANPFLKPRSGGVNGFDALLSRVKRLVADNPGAVILVNGDSHTYRDDEPLPGPSAHRAVGLADRELVARLDHRRHQSRRRRGVLMKWASLVLGLLAGCASRRTAASLSP